MIAIDSGDSLLVQKWAAEGRLPNLVQLLNSGAVASIETPAGVLEGAVWPTLLMSMSPGNHGLFAYRQIKPGTYDLEIAMRANRLPEAPFWVPLSRAGKRVAIIDAPFAKPSKGLNGIQVTNWGAHDPWSWKRSSWPPRLIDDLVTKFGDHPVGMCDAQGRSLKDYEDLRNALIVGVRKKTELLRYCLKQEDWDLFFGVFSESHCVGHQCWHLMDADCPRHVPDAPPRLPLAIRDVYQEIDKGIGVLFEELTPDTSIFVLLSHGMGAYYHGSHLLNQVLKRLEANDAAKNSFHGNGHISGYGFKSELWNARRIVPISVRQGLKASLPKPMLESLWHWTHPAPHPWAQVRVFQVPSSNMTGALRINLKGREPAGLVQSGAEYDDLCQELTGALMELQNPATGRKAVQWVARSSELYQGKRLSWLPDLFIEWDHSAPITELSSPRIGTVAGVPQGSRTGSHWANALLIGSGPGIKPGNVTDELRTIDVAPTILGIFGIQQPRYFEGKDRSALFGLANGAPSSQRIHGLSHGAVS